MPGFLWKPGAFVNQPFAEGSLGRIRLSRMAMRAATTTEEEPNTVLTQAGKPSPARQPDTWVIPTPRATDRPTTELLRGVKPPSVIIRMPVMVMVANTEMVAPPMTHWGMVVSREANLGTSPATSRMRAARAKTADWNGTLLDDAALCCELLNTMLARHGYAPVGSMEAYRQVFCFPIETYYRRAGFDFSRHPFAALADEYMRLYTPRSLGCPLQPDACAVLDALRAQGMRQVMLSASKRENLQQQVEHFGLRSRFDTLLGLSDIYAKSKTEVGLRWLRESGADPARIMMVGDSEHDFEVARALGVRCVLFSGGHQPREVLAATGAPVIDALAQLLPLLAQLAAE